MEKDFNIQNYTFYDILHLLNLPYEFQTSHLAELKKKITLLNQPNVSTDIYHFYKKTFIIVNCIHKYREKKSEFDLDYFPEIEEDTLLYDDILKIPDFERLPSPEQILELVLKNNEELKIKINDDTPEEITEGIQDRYARSKPMPTLSSHVPLAPGSVNSIKRQLQTRNLYFNSSFREDTNTYSTSSDFRYIIPSEINNVVSMQLTSIELPDSWYLCNSHSYDLDGTTYSIADGNYDSTSIITAINDTKHANVTFSINSNTLKTTITNTSDATITFSTSENDKMKSFGWLLGFREMSYTLEANVPLESEGLFNDGTRRYFYFCVNDFQNNVNETNSICLQNNLSDKHILSKICLQDTKHFMRSSTGSKRNYNGPIDLKRLNIQLLDEHGEIIKLNNMDVGFTLQLELLYERDLIV